MRTRNANTVVSGLAELRDEVEIEVGDRQRGADDADALRGELRGEVVAREHRDRRVAGLELTHTVGADADAGEQQPLGRALGGDAGAELADRVPADLAAAAADADQRAQRAAAAPGAREQVRG